MTVLKKQAGKSLVVQWLRLCASTAGGSSVIPDGGTKILHPSQCGQKKTFLIKYIKNISWRKRNFKGMKYTENLTYKDIRGSI